MLKRRFNLSGLCLAVLSVAIVLGASPASADPGDTSWRYLTGGEIISSPAIGADGTIYMGSYDHLLYAVNPDRTSKWYYDTDDQIYSSPVIGPDGTIYVGSHDSFLYAINPEDGSLKWRYPTGGMIYFSPAIGADGTIYIGSYDSYLYAISPEGVFKWRYPTNGWIASSPAIGADDTVYVGDMNGTLYAINADGSAKWTFETGGWIASSPAIASDGTIYVGNWDSSLYAVNPDGSAKWRYETGGWIASSPAIGADGTIYVGSWDNSLYAINPSGIKKWAYETGSAIWSSPAIGADGTIYVGSWDNSLYAVNSNGTLRWAHETDGEIWSSPAIGADGTVYVGSSDKYLYAVEGDAPWTDADYEAAMDAYADSPWPKFGQNNFNIHRNATPLPPDLEPEVPSLSLPAGASVYPDATVSVPLTLTNTEDNLFIQTIAAEITFDTVLFDLLDVTLENGLLEGGDYTVSYEEDEGKITLLVNAGESYLFKGSGEVIHLEFAALGNVGDTSALTFVSAQVNEFELEAEDMTSGAVNVVEKPDSEPMTMSLPGSVEVFPGDVLAVPLALNNSGAVEIEGIDVEIEFDADVLTATGASLTDGILEDENYGLYAEVGEGTLGVTIYARSEMLTSEGVIVYLIFTAVGNVDDTTALSFTTAQSNESGVNATNGSVRIMDPAFNISGNIVYYGAESDTTPPSVPNVQVLLEETASGDEDPDDLFSTTADTDENGNYTFADIARGDYVATPAKADDLGGLTGTDASRIARYAAGLFFGFDDYQLIAADVTRNGEITGTDASRVARYIAGEIDCLNDTCEHWVFIPDVPEAGDDLSAISYAPSREYPDLDSDKTGENFIAIRLGDVTKNWEPGGDEGRGREYSEYTGPESDVYAASGDLLTLPVVLDQSAAIEGLDIRIEFDENILALEDVTLAGGILENENYGLQVNTSADGEISLTVMARGDVVAGSGEVLLIDFHVVGQTPSTSTVSLTTFDCNEAPASGGFSPNGGSYQSLRLEVDPYI